MKNNMNKKQVEKILATVVMGMNLVNATAPMVALAAAEQPAQPLPKRAGSEAQPLDYALLPRLADIVDRAIFARAEATDYSGNASVADMVSGDTQNITAGQSGTVSTMNGGYQYVSNGGTATVSTMSGGVQNVSSGGTATVSTMDGGWEYVQGNATINTMITGGQEIKSGGTGTISTMNSGFQGMSNGGTGIIIDMSGGRQEIETGGTGTVSTMSGGTQVIGNGILRVDAVGIVSTMLDGGKQVIYKGGIGSVGTMSGGQQDVSISGTGIIDTMSDGTQAIDSGTGTISTMSGGSQTINGGTGTISTMINGSQSISDGGTGTINTMISGSQSIAGGGTGSVGTMSGGVQNVFNSGTGIIDIMNGGSQTISSGGTGTVSTMNGGSQSISSGATGSVGTMSGGAQTIYNGATGSVGTMSGGTQTIWGGGTGTVGTMSGGSQNISSGCTGTVSNMTDGTQNVFNSATGSVGTMSGGMQTIFGGTGSVGTMSGGTQTINSGTGTVGTMSGGTQFISGGCTGSVSTMSGGVQNVDSSGTGIIDIMISGSQTIYSGGTGTVSTMSGGTQEVYGAGIVSTMNGGVQSIYNGGTGTVDTMSGGTQSISRGGNGTIVTMDSGSQVIQSGILDTDLAGETNGDKVIINDAEVGKHYVQIKDLSSLNGIEVTGAHQQLLITDASGKLTFEGKEFNAGGLWDIDPTLAKGDTLGLSDKDWYLTKVAKTVNNDTGVLLDAADNSYALWRNTNDSLRSRLGALASGSAQADGIWVRTQAGRFSGNGYEGRYNMYQFGYDKADNAKSIYGGAIDYGDGTGSYQPGSGKDKLKSFSLYGIWTGDSGTYTNVTARAGNFSTDLESYGDFPDKASYKQHAYSISVEYGKRFDLERGLFFEPNVQFTLGRLGSISYTTDRGANGHIDGMNSAIGRIGFVMGQKITNGSDIYLKADLLHEFAGERDLVLTSDAGGTNDILTKHNDYGDTWFELGVGGNVKISKAGNLYGEVVRGFGGDINKKWQLNAGIRFTF